MNPSPPHDPTHPPEAQGPKPGPVRRFALLILLLAVTVAAVAAGLPQKLSPEALVRSRDALRAMSGSAMAPALAVYVVGYALLTGALLPVALALSLAGGLVFGAWIGGAAVLAGATGGALLTYAAARSAFAPALLARAERDPRLAGLMQGFGRDAFSYILTLRLLPFFPFALVNVGSGLANVPARTYALATLAGGVPTAFIYASLGAGLGASIGSKHVLAQAASSPGVVAPLVTLSLLSLAPPLLKRRRRSRES